MDWSEGFKSAASKEADSGQHGIVGQAIWSKVAGKKGSDDTAADPPSYKKGGTVRKSGMAKVHKGEKVLTKRQSKSLKKR